MVWSREGRDVGRVYGMKERTLDLTERTAIEMIGFLERHIVKVFMRD